MGVVKGHQFALGSLFRRVLTGQLWGGREKQNEFDLI